MVGTTIQLGPRTPSPIRSNKGRSLLDFPLNYTAIDIETTGLDPCFDEIIEVAAIRYVDGKEQARFQSLIKPQNEVSDFIEELTGITNEIGR